MKHLVISASLILSSACAADPSPAADSAQVAQSVAPESVAPPSLYERLGGMPTINRIVDGLVTNAASDERIRRFFERIRGDTASIRLLKEKLADQLCQGSGGPCSYSGLDMRSAHLGMNLSDTDFDAMIENLVVALDSAGVSQREKDDLLAVVAPMRADIVTKR